MRAASEMEHDTAVLFFSDGHEAPPLGVGERGMPAVGKLSVNGIVVGVGGREPARIPKYDANSRFIGYWGPGEVVQQSNAANGHSREELSEVKEQHLTDLARWSQLSYVHLQSANALIDTIKKDNLGTKQMVPTDLRWIPAALALLILCWYFRPVVRRSKYGVHKNIV